MATETVPAVTAITTDDLQALLAGCRHILAASEVFTPLAERAIETLEDLAKGQPERVQWRVKDLCRDLAAALDQLTEEADFIEWQMDDMADDDDG